MELAVPCPSCKLLSACDCKQVLVSFFSLLERVHKRVLSTKVTSNQPHPTLISAGVDKLEIKFKGPVKIAEILKKIHTLGCKYKIVSLKNKRPHLRITQGELQLHLTLNLHEQCVTGLVSNPNRFGSWTNYITFLEQLFTNPTLQSSKIQRLDLNLDFSFSFADLIQQIDVKDKSTAINFNDKGGKRTGLNIGKKPELIVIYDKAEKSKTPAPHSRIEIRLNRPKIKIESIYDLPEQLNFQDYFHNIIGRTLKFNEANLSDIQNERLQEFKSILKRDGFYSARKHMNQERNFDRDFAKILKTQSWGASPYELFKQGIERFLGPPQTNIKLVH